MNKKILKSNTFADALEGVISTIKARKVDFDVKHILLVPEKDTLKCEKMLFSGGGAFDVEVYSLSRWFFKLGGDCLPKTGAIMLLKDILYSLELKCFYRSKNFEGFCTRLYDTICNLEENKSSLEGIKVGGALSLKLDDLKRITAEFKRRTEGMYVDKAGKINLIASRLKTDNFLKNAHVYAANFGVFTAAERSLMDLIAQKSLSFTVAEVEGEPQIKGEVEIYKASGMVNALKASAARIISAAKEGVKFSEMCVVLPKKAAGQCRRVLGENGIPFYIDTTANVAASGLGRYISLLLSLKRLTRRDFVLLSKNPFSGVEPNDSDVFENYCNEFLIDYLSFSRPFEFFDASSDALAQQIRLKTAEKVRALLYKKRTDFWGRLEAAKNTAEFTSVIRAALDKAEDSPQRQRIFGVLDTLDRFMGGEVNANRLQFLVSAFKEGISAESISTLPRRQGCVTVGDAGIFKGERFKRTFVVGFNEGEVPEIAAENGLITAAECAVLSGQGIEILAEEQENRRREYEFMQLLSASDKIFLSSFQTAKSRPSPLLYEIISAVNERDFKRAGKSGEKTPFSQRGASSITFSGAERDRLALIYGDNKVLSELVQSESAARELFILTHDKPQKLTAALKEVLGSSEGLSPSPPPKNLKSGVFFKGYDLSKATVSVSQLRTYFACPYKHFVEYGLRAAREKSGAVSFLDIGSAVHDVVQKYVEYFLDDARLEEITDEVLSCGVYKLKQNQRLKTRLKKEIMASVAALGALIRRGKFTGQRAETRFGIVSENPQNSQNPQNPQKKAAELRGCNIGGVTLKGAIDLYDTFDGYARVVDYKTGAAKFSEKDLYYGRGIQLPLYMAVMSENGLNPAAMLYFLFSSKWSDEEMKFSGVYLKDMPVLLAFDPEMQEQNAALPARIKTTKAGEKVEGKGAVDLSVMYAYMEYAKAVCERAVAQILSGVITPTPLKERYLSCNNCDFLPACGFRGRPREQKSVLIASGDGEETDED